jgi:DNA-binding MarR family transcriptional regulator
MTQVRRGKAAFARAEERRARNLRQLLLRASRIVNRDVVRGLQAHGYAALRATHTTLLSNMDLAGSTVSEVAERAGITKQAMGRLAAQLEAAGYIRVTGDPRDARIKLLRLTATGERLMFESFEVMSRLEQRYAALVGDAHYAALIRGLHALVTRTRATASSRASSTGT